MRENFDINKKDMLEQKAFIKNLEIYYKTAGEGKPLLILHGWESKSDNWIKVMELLSSKIKVIIPDLPGFGKSNKPPLPWTLDDYVSFVEEFKDHLGLEKFYLLGHSFGGAVAVKYALCNKVNKLFLVAASCIRRKTLKKKILFVVSKVFKIFGFIPYLRKAFYRFFVKSDYLTAKGLMKKTYLNVIKEDLTGELKNIKDPVLIVWGENDTITPLKEAQIIKENIKGSKLVVIPSAGHDLERKTPEALAKKILCSI